MLSISEFSETDLEAFRKALLELGLQPVTAYNYKSHVKASLKRGGWGVDLEWQAKLSAGTQVRYATAWRKWLKFRQGDFVPGATSAEQRSAKACEVFMLSRVSPAYAASVVAVFRRVRPWASFDEIEATYDGATPRVRDHMIRSWPHFAAWHHAAGVRAPTPVFDMQLTVDAAMALQGLMARGAAPALLHQLVMNAHGTVAAILDAVLVVDGAGARWCARTLLERADASPWVLCARPGSPIRVHRQWLLDYADSNNGFPLAEALAHRWQHEASPVQVPRVDGAKVPDFPGE